MGEDSEAAAAGPAVEDAWAMEGRSSTEMGKIVLPVNWFTGKFVFACITSGNRFYQ